VRRPKSNKPKGYWQDIDNCRAFLDRIAQENGFNPLEIRSWYNLGRAEIFKQVTFGVCYHYCLSSQGFFLGRCCDANSKWWTQGAPQKSVP